MVTNDDKLYDEILFHIGNNGKFQKKFNYLFNFFFIIFATMTSFNIILAMAVPDHWCKASGRESTNFTMEQWKTFAIPWKNSSLGLKNFEKCLMYDENKTISECHFGYEYDQTWYIETIPSKENWVCQNDMHVTNSFTVNRVGEIIGTFVFGQLGDKYGRKPTFVVSLVMMMIGRVMTMFTTNNFPLFLFAQFLGSMSSLAVFQSPLIIGIETTKDENRTFISLLQCVSWTIGLCILPFVFWLSGDWFMFMLLTTVPLTPFLFLNRYMIESPRWLVSRGHIKKCYKVLKKIAKTNKSFISENHISQLEKLQETDVIESKEENFFSLFSTWAMVKISLNTMLGWGCYMVIYITLYLNVTNLGGNPFLNFFWQSLAELPGYFLGKYLADTMGRKYTRFFSFLATTAGCILLMFFIKDPKYEWVVTVISVFLKFSTSVAFYVISLHSLEIFPTNLRQSGTSMGTIVGYIFGLGSPYVIYLGTSVDARYPYVLTGILALIGGVFAIFLPETLNQKLPETVQEVEEFGKDQKMFSWPKSPGKCVHTVVINKE